MNVRKALSSLYLNVSRLLNEFSSFYYVPMNQITDVNIQIRDIWLDNV